MSQEVFLRGILFAIMAAVFAGMVYFRHDDDPSLDPGVDDRPRYIPYIHGSLLPGFIFGFAILGSIILGVGFTARRILSICFSIFLHISLYYLVLLPVLPLLRKAISARACAMLWLIPNYLYLIVNRGIDPPSPLFVVTARGSLIWVLFGIWLAGFLAVLIWKFTEHVLFRRRILREARPAADPEILRIWKILLADARFRKPKFRLMTSPNVTTPLTVGLFARSTRVVLPERPYTQEELELILRHELVHIGREDAWTKFFMVFCTAMCWFNPLMWIAMRHSADDMELSCDETVLLHADDAARKRYAHLLLNTAGDERGFTTCLSATAKALRYRLGRITRPGKRRSGALIVGTIFFIFCMTGGYVSLAYGGSSGAEVLYHGADASDYALTGDEVTDEGAFHDYLSKLTLCDMTGDYSFSDSEHWISLRLKTPEGVSLVSLYDEVIKVVPLYLERQNAQYYYVPGGLDWAYLESIL